MKIKTTLNLWNIAKIMPSGSVMALNPHNRKEEIETKELSKPWQVFSTEGRIQNTLRF